MRKARRKVNNLGKKSYQNPQDRQIYCTYVKARQEYKRDCRKSKVAHGNKLTHELEESVDSKNQIKFWEKFKKIRKPYQPQKGPTLNALYEHLKKLNTDTHVPSFDETFRNYIETNLNTSLQENQNDNDLDKIITQEEILKAVNNLKNKKAHGNDLVGNEMLKVAINTIIKEIAALFNAVIKSSICPSAWCTGIITPIYKTGDITDPTNYPGITISNNIGKLFTSILNNRLVSFLNKNNVICNEQIGFRKGYRTSDHILVLTSLIDHYKIKKREIYVCYIDFSKAFDKRWRSGLLYKMKSIKLSSSFINLL